MEYVDNSLTAKRDWERAQAQHHVQLQKIKPLANEFHISDNYFRTRRILSRGKTYKDEQQLSRIQQQNLQFVSKILQAQRLTTRASSVPRRDSLNYRSRKGEVDRLNVENWRLAQRIVSARSDLSVKRCEEHYRKLAKVKQLRTKVHKF